ncbi:MAG: GGDEF domain-containing protein [Oscillospiraceae bacterium]
MEKQKKLRKFLLIIIPTIVVAVLIFASIKTYSLYISAEKTRTFEYFSYAVNSCKTQLQDKIGGLLDDAKNTAFTLSQTDTDAASIEKAFAFHALTTEAETGLVFNSHGEQTFGDPDLGGVFSETAKDALIKNGSSVSDYILCPDGEERLAIAFCYNNRLNELCVSLLVFPHSLIDTVVELSILSGEGRLSIVRSDGSPVAMDVEKAPWLSDGALSPEIIASSQSRLAECSAPSPKNEFVALGRALEINDWVLVGTAPMAVVNVHAQQSAKITYGFIGVVVLLFSLTFCFSYYELYVSRRQISLSRKKLRIAVKQTARAAFQYDRRRDIFSFITTCESIKLPDEEGHNSLSSFLSCIYPTDLPKVKTALSELASTNSIAITMRMSKLCGTNEYRWYRLNATRLNKSGLGSNLTIGSIEDIDERQKERLSLHKKATTDSLTGLCSRGEAERLIEEQLERLSDKETASFAIIDLDNFKSINDSYGHDCGDRALKLFSEKLQSIFRHGDIIGRLGGDEFVVYMTFTPEQEIVERRLRELSTRLSSESCEDSRLPSVTCSAGYVRALPGDSFESIYKRADAALYKAKALGKRQAVFGE